MNKTEIENQLNNFFGKAKEKNMEDSKPEIRTDIIAGTMNDPRVDSNGEVIDKVVKYGTLEDGTQYGKKVILVDSLTQKGDQIFWMYQKVGRAFINDNKTEEKSYDFSGDIDGGEFENKPKKFFAYKKINEENQSEFFSLSVINKSE